MKGLEIIPSTRQLQEAYGVLQADPGAVSVREFVLYSQWARLDPRLAEILVGYLRARWKSFNPLEVNEALLKSPWPASMGVLMDQARTYSRFMPAERRAFASWQKCAMVSVRPAEGELFFLGLRSFAGKVMLKDAEFPLRSYTRWGYLGREILINKASASPARTSLDPARRRQVLRQLLRGRRHITVEDYMSALEGTVSRRQAQIDLKAAKLITSGNTRSRIYRAR
ncbi:MAG: hypothetical protein NDI61_08820 [Bdellovibrionaceae bacterium]|nr:hypothetical protein [Pseudobdellovibrionaceae bacterium]